MMGVATTSARGRSGKGGEGRSGKDGWGILVLITACMHAIPTVIQAPLETKQAKTSCKHGGEVVGYPIASFPGHLKNGLGMRQVF